MAAAVYPEVNRSGAGKDTGKRAKLHRRVDAQNQIHCL